MFYFFSPSLSNLKNRYAKFQRKWKKIFFFATTEKRKKISLMNYFLKTVALEILVEKMFLSKKKVKIIYTAHYNSKDGHWLQHEYRVDCVKMYYENRIIYE